MRNVGTYDTDRHSLIPVGVFDRLAEVANAELAAQLRYLGPNRDPLTIIEIWLAGKQTIPMPGPRSEPGDLLIKQDRGEQWMLTSRGWRELAPIELQADVENLAAADPFPPGAPREFQDGDPMVQPEPGVAPRFWGRSVAEDELDKMRRDVGAGGACGRHGVYSGRVCPACRREAEENVILARERVEEAEHAQRHDDADTHRRRYVEAGGAFDARAAAQTAAPREFPPVVKRCLAELVELENAIDVTLEAAADTDLASNAASTLRSFKDGIDLSRKLLLDIATRDLRS